MFPKLTIIIPVYKAEKYLNQALDSVLLQSFSGFEIIAVNDASTDSSLSILTGYQKKDNRLKVIDLKENKKQGFARNLAIQKAQGDFIVFLDADDFLGPNTFSYLAKRIKKRPETEVFVWGYRLCNAKGKIKKTLLPQKPEKKLGESPFELMMLNRKGFNAYTCICVVKTTVLKKHKIFFGEKGFYEDVIFSKKLIYHARKVRVIPKAFYHYRKHKGATTGRSSARKIKDKFAVYGQIKSFLIENGTYFRYEKAYKASYLAFCVFTSFNDYFSLSASERNKSLDDFMTALRKGSLLKNDNLNLLKSIANALSPVKEKQSKRFYYMAYYGLKAIKNRYRIHCFINRSFNRLHRIIT